MAASFGNIQLCGSIMIDGRLELSEASISWTAKGGGKTVNITGDKIKAASFLDLGRSCQLWVTDADGSLYRFEGFKSLEFDRISAALPPSTELKRRALGSKGGNWGSARVRGSQLELLDGDGRLVAPIPVASLSQVALPGKGELDLQFLDDEDAGAGGADDEVLVEMRLFVPAGHALAGVDEAAAEAALAKARARAKARGKAPQQQQQQTGSDVEGGADEDAAVADAAASAGGASVILHSLLTDAAGISGAGGGDAIAELSEEVGQLVVPRGRYAIEFYPSFMRLVGRTYEFKVAYRSIARLFYLEKPYAVGDAATRFNFVVALTDPIRQGNQRHPYLVLHLEAKGGAEFSVPLRLSPEDVAEGRFGGIGAGGRTSLSGSLPKIVASLFKYMTGKPVFKSPDDFRSAAGQKSVRCSVKNADGLLYPLDKSVVFLHKPTQWISYAEVEHAELRRSDAAGGSSTASRTFDLVLHTRSAAGEAAREYVYQNIDNHERQRLRDWLSGKNLRVTEPDARAGASAAGIAHALAEDDDDDDDDDDDGAGAKRKRGGGGEDDEDEDEEEDEDFAGGESGSDDDDSGSDDGDGGSEDGFRRKSKHKKKSRSGSEKKSRKEKKKKPRSRRSGDDD